MATRMNRCLCSPLACMLAISTALRLSFVCFRFLFLVVFSVFVFVFFLFVCLFVVCFCLVLFCFCFFVLFWFCFGVFSVVFFLGWLVGLFSFFFYFNFNFLIGCFFLKHVTSPLKSDFDKVRLDYKHPCWYECAFFCIYWWLVIKMYSYCVFFLHSLNGLKFQCLFPFIFLIYSFIHLKKKFRIRRSFSVSVFRYLCSLIFHKWMNEKCKGLIVIYFVIYFPRTFFHITRLRFVSFMAVLSHLFDKPLKLFVRNMYNNM